jgi:hypothetical protein
MKNVIFSILFILTFSVIGYSETITLTLKNKGLMVEDLSYELGYQDIVSEAPNPQTKAEYVIETISSHLSSAGNDYQFVHPVNEIVITFDNVKLPNIVDGFSRSHGWNPSNPLSKKVFMRNVIKGFIRKGYQKIKINQWKSGRKQVIEDADNYTSDVSVE